MNKKRGQAGQTIVLAENIDAGALFIVIGEGRYPTGIGEKIDVLGKPTARKIGAKALDGAGRRRIDAEPVRGVRHALRP
jgi:hypothetical protein